MEEKKKKSKEEQIKLIDDNIEEAKKLQEGINKAVKELDDSVCPRILEELGYQYSNVVRMISELEKMKDAILNQGLGNEYADKAFAIGY
jgi:predicted butyrate kinase (DUF1464 family)